MELRADLKNRYYFVDIYHETMATNQDIKDAMFLSEDFLQNTTNIPEGYPTMLGICRAHSKPGQNICKR